jgi:protein-tyrosine-phosphatase/DNA-binding transcriptional ArsR family regulator
MYLDERAQTLAALGDRHRLRIVDELLLGDRTFNELATAVDQPTNAAAHHIGVLEAAGLIERRVSEGDHRRRYIHLRQDQLDGLIPIEPVTRGFVLFVCTHNSARSQFAAALWQMRTGLAAESAGTQPAQRVHPLAVSVAAEFDLDLAGAQPKGYAAVKREPDLVVSVCDRAHEAGWPFAAPSLHWSVPDPVPVGKLAAFRTSFRELAERVDRLTATI